MRKVPTGTMGCSASRQTFDNAGIESAKPTPIKALPGSAVLKASKKQASAISKVQNKAAATSSSSSSQQQTLEKD